MWNSHLLLLALDLKLSGGQIKHPGAGHPNSSQHPNLLIPHPPMEHMQCIPHILIMANIRMHCKYATELALHSRFLMYIWENCQNRCNKNKDIFFSIPWIFQTSLLKTWCLYFPRCNSTNSRSSLPPLEPQKGLYNLLHIPYATMPLWTCEQPLICHVSLPVSRFSILASHHSWNKWQEETNKAEMNYSQSKLLYKLYLFNVHEKMCIKCFVVFIVAVVGPIIRYSSYWALKCKMLSYYEINTWIIVQMCVNMWLYQ